jgi:Ni,Fe-hydrogenase III small subunit
MRKLLFESLVRFPVTESPPSASEAAMEELARAVDQAGPPAAGPQPFGPRGGCRLVQRLRAGDQCAEQRLYDIERFGIRFVASPRHADVLLVTGPVTRNMREALERTYNATPDPKWVVAVGDCAADGGCFAGSYAVVGGVSEVVPVDLHVPGCPPPPLEILKALLALLQPTRARVSTG